jgi:hypothetical protein
MSCLLLSGKTTFIVVEKTRRLADQPIETGKIGAEDAAKVNRQHNLLVGLNDKWKRD